jgi:serine/threonine-protein kinase
MNRRVAVKELSLPATLSGQARRERIERFYREARAAGAMSHPAIVTIYEVGEDDGRYFIAMEYLEGQTLRERLQNGPLPLSEAVRIISVLCDALSYAHARGVIHRDIKPDNVHLLPGGEVKLTDFGIARITHEESLTLDGQIFGTPSYMSPEQVVGKHIDSRSDIFSLGILLYEMLSGRKPFTGDSVVTITYRILHDDLPGLPSVPVIVDSVVRRAAAKDPAAGSRARPTSKARLVQAASGPDTRAAWEYASSAAAASRPGGGGATGGLPAQSTVAYSGARTQAGAAGSAPGLAPAPTQRAVVNVFDDYAAATADYGTSGQGASGAKAS